MSPHPQALFKCSLSCPTPLNPECGWAPPDEGALLAWIHQPMLRAPSRGILDGSRPEAAALIAPPSFQDLDSGRFFQLKVLRHMSRGRRCVPASARPVSEFLFETCRARCDHPV